MKKFLKLHRSFFLHTKGHVFLLHKNTGKVIIGVFLCFFISIFFIPSFSFALGNIFFGSIPSLYNVKLAQILYKRAAYPLFPKSTPRYAHHQLSSAYFVQGDLNNALDEAKEELKIYPDDIKAYYLIGLTLGYMNKNYEAIDVFSQYIEKNPGTWAGRNDKAWLQFKIGDIEGAIETIEPVAQNFKFTPWIQNTYCALLINKKERSDDARIVCNNAKELIYKMTKNDWGWAYPGNDPRIYETGLEGMKKSIDANVSILENRRIAR